jgi:hypothetical protein
MTEEEIRYLAEKFGVAPDTGFRPGSFETPEAFGTKRDPTAGALSQGMSDAERRRVKKERDEVRSGLSTLDKAKGVLEAGAMLGTAIPSAMIAPFAKEFTGTPEEDFINKYMYVPRTEAGLLYADEGGEGIESRIEAIGESPLGKALGPIVDKIPVYTPLMGAPAHMAGRIGKATKTATDKAQELTQEGQDILRKGSDYETSQEGPFYRVRPASQGSGQAVRGNKEEARTGAPDTGGAVRGDVPQPITDAQVADVMAQPDNFVRSVASQYAQEVNGQPYELPEMAPSSLLKQAPIGRAFDLAVSEDPQYKNRVFEAYGQAMPEVIEQSGAKNYDQLVEAAYRQLAKETDAQFRRLPVSMSFHRAGEGNYSDSKDMLRDVYGNRHLYVFQGGDPHPFLNQVDPVTGLNDNEKFRAVHDFFGHAIHGNQFGPKGEETAWLAHSQMYSPLARLAMSTETRGQNSVVNYTPLNAQLKRSLSEVEGRIMEARRRNQTDDLKELQAIKRDLFNQFQYAPQQGLLLPPEMIRPDYAGKMPDYLQPLIKPAPGTAQSARLTHFSGEPSMKVTDPSRYGSGIKGAEAERLAGAPDIRPRTYFYTGENPTPETGLGPFRYGAEADLYNLTEDPLSFRALASESLRSPFTSKANPGMVDPMEATTAAERLVKEYGYPGYMNPEFGAATVFQPMEVQRYAPGGKVVKGALSGIDAAKQASKAARRQERVDKNLQRWSGSEEKSPVYYHGTSAREDFSVFDPEKRPTKKSSSAVFMTPSKEWSSDWIDTNPEILEKFPSSKPRVMPLITRAKNSFDYENPEHVQAVVGRAKLPKAFTPDYVAERIGEGNWNFIEDQNIQKAIKDQGFDSFFVKEKGVKNLGVFNPADVKSLFNRGSFSEDPDISKAEGGMVSADQIRERLKGVFNFAGGGAAKASEPAKPEVHPFLARLRGFKKGGEVKLGIGGDALKRAKSGVGQALKAVKGAQKRQQPAPAVEDVEDTAAKKEKKPPYTQEQLQTTAKDMRRAIKKDNPKFTPDQVQAKALEQAKKKLDYEIVIRPSMQKKYGEIAEAPYYAGNLERKQNTPEAIQARIKKAEDLLSKPTEPWNPPRKELQAFDRERIKDALEGFPGIEQTRFPRYQAPKSGSASLIEEIYQDPVNRRLIEGQIKRGLPLGGETFYASLYPLKLAAMERGMTEKQFNQFIYSIAPASARNSIMNEMAVGQFLRDMHARGLPLDPATIDKEKAKFKAKHVRGLPSMPIHHEGVRRVLEDDIDLREMSKASDLTSYKIPTYGAQKAGDFGKSVVLDVHEAGGETLASKYHPYFSEQGGFSRTEYGPAEDQMLQIAQDLGLPGGMAQAGRWFGGGELTGLVSPRGDALDLLEKQTAYSLQGQGIKPTPRNIRNYVLDMMETGQGVLLPWWSRKPMPDYRTEKKKGGLVAFER